MKKEGIFAKAESRGLRVCLTEDGVWITEGGENRLLLDF